MFKKQTNTHTNRKRNMKNGWKHINTRTVWQRERVEHVDLNTLGRKSQQDTGETVNEGRFNRWGKNQGRKCKAEQDTRGEKSLK